MNKISEKKYNIVIAISLVILFIIYCCESSRVSMWLDDILQIGMVGKDIPKEKFLYNIINHDLQPPMAHIVTAIWTRIAPYGNFWMRLPSIIFVSLGSVICAKVVKEIEGSLTAIFVFFGLFCSYNVVLNAAFVIRPYGLLILMSSLVMYSLYKRITTNKTLWIVLYGLFSLLLMYTHYFGCLVVFAFFVSDFLLFVKKQIKIKHFLAYL